MQLLNQLRVELRVEVGTVQLSAADLLDLTPGALVSVAYESDRSIRLLLGGEEIAKAQFVENEQGGLALQVLSINHTEEELKQIDEIEREYQGRGREEER